MGGSGRGIPVSIGWRSRPPSLLGGRRAAGGLAALRLRVASSWSCRVAVVLSSCRRRLRRSCRRRRLGSPPLVAPCPLPVGVARSHLASTALLLLGWGLGISCPLPRRCVVVGGWGRSSPFPTFGAPWSGGAGVGLVLVVLSLFGSRSSVLGCSFFCCCCCLLAAQVIMEFVYARLHRLRAEAGGSGSGGRVPTSPPLWEEGTPLTQLCSGAPPPLSLRDAS